MSIETALKNYQGCENCTGQLFELCFNVIGQVPEDGVNHVWELLVEENIEPRYWGEVIKNLKCSKCKSRLQLNDYIIEDYDTFLEAVTEQIIDVVNSQIYQCQSCNSDIIPYIQKHEDPADLNTGAELLAEYDLPQDIYDVVAENLQCKCGESINSDDPYVTAAEVGKWYGYSAEVVIKTFGIHRGEAEDFIQFLTEHPMMGLDHSVGKKILEIIQRREIQGIKKINVGDVFYRSRKREVSENPYPYLSEELQAPPIGVSKHGRYNPVGVSVLYLADSPKTSLREIDLEDGNKAVADIAKVVALTELEVWDVRSLDLKDFISMPSMNKDIISQEYLLPNFLSQCCSYAKINGVVYDSVKNKSGYNLALLNYQIGETIALFKCMENVKMKDVMVYKKLPKKMRIVDDPGIEAIEL